MTRHTGKHAARLTAARTEPSPITALRDMLATAFAADIAAVTPMVCDIMHWDRLGAATATGQDGTAAVGRILGHKSGALAMEIARTFRTHGMHVERAL
jgi:hypothetical protein